MAPERNSSARRNQIALPSQFIGPPQRTSLVLLAEAPTAASKSTVKWPVFAEVHRMY
jgi:hypothetical protein